MGLLTHFHLHLFFHRFSGSDPMISINPMDFRADLYGSVERLQYSLIPGRGKGIRVLPMVTITKETTPVVSRAGISVFPLCGSWRTDWRRKTPPIFMDCSNSSQFYIPVSQSFSHPDFISLYPRVSPIPLELLGAAAFPSSQRNQI